MESKNKNDISDETLKGKEAKRCPVSEADIEPCFKGRLYDDQPQTAGGASNLLLIHSSHDTSSANALSASNKFEDAGILNKLPQIPSTSNKYEDAEIINKLPQIPSTSTMTKDSHQDKSDSSKDIYIDNNSQSLRSPHSQDQCKNEFLSHGESKDLEENSSTQNQSEVSDCPSLECIAATDCENPAPQCMKNCNSNQQSDKAIVTSELSHMCETPLPQTSDGSDILEDDVKVCDICGDTGREEMLAICSRCSDGAEHTYCMQVMLDKVPEGDWLCEECQLKEDAEKQELDKTKMVPATPEEPPLKEKSIEGISNQKLLPKLDGRTDESEISQASTPKEPSLMEKSFGGTLNPKLLPKMDSKTDQTEVKQGSKAIASSRLSAKRQADILEDSSKSKKQAIEPSAGSPGMTSPRKKPALSRESSFKSLDVGKVKQANQVPSSESQCANISKEGGSSLSTTASDSPRLQLQQSSRGFLSRSATFSNLSSKPKVKPLLEDTFQKQKLPRDSSTNFTRKDVLIKKSMSFRMPNSGRSNMIESKAKMWPSKLYQLEETRGLKQAKEQNRMERKNSFKLDRPVISSSKATGTSMPLQKGGPKSVFRGEGTSLVASVNNSSDPKHAECDGKNTSLDASVSFADKVSNSAIASGRCNSMEQKAHKFGTKEHTTASSSCAADESSGNPNIVLQDDLSKSREATKQDEKTMDPPPSLSNYTVSSADETKLKPSVMKLATQASVTANFLRFSAIPEHDYTWQGGFEVQRSGQLIDYFDGIQAHISTCASMRVLEVVNKFSCKVQLEEVPRLNVWPVQFQDKATEDNIGLYFFAKDLDCYKMNYKKLLDNMMKNDLALKGNVEGTELLIFPSNQLHEKSQCWNRLFFLWAVFRERRVNNAEFQSGPGEKLCEAGLDLDPSVQAPVKTGVNMYKKPSANGQLDEELSPCDISSKEPESVKSTDEDLPFLSSSKRMDGQLYVEAPSLDKKPINFHQHNNLLAINDTHSSEKQRSCSVSEIHLSTMATQLSSLHKGSLLASTPVKNAQFGSEVKDNSISLREVYRDSKNEKETELQPHAPSTTIQNDLNNELITQCRHADFTSRTPDRQDTSSHPLKVFPVHSSSLVREAGSRETFTDDLSSVEAERWEPIEKNSSWDSKSSRKRPLSNSPETSSEASVEISKTIQALTWKDSACIAVDGETNGKKMKCSIDLHVQSSSQKQILVDGFSSKIIDLDPNSINVEQTGVYSYDNTAFSDNSRNAERYLFPLDSGNVRDLRSGKNMPWQVLSADNEDVSESDVPNLELALGAKKKSQKQEVLPLFGQLADGKSDQTKVAFSSSNDGNDDLSASLSLSLSFPFHEKDQTAKSVSKTEELLPNRHHVNTSLLLFGGFTDN